MCDRPWSGGALAALTLVASTFVGCPLWTSHFHATHVTADFVAESRSARTFWIDRADSALESGHDEFCNSLMCIAGARSELERALATSLGHIATEAAGSSAEYVARFDRLAFTFVCGRYAGCSMTLGWSFRLTEAATGEEVAVLGDTETLEHTGNDEAGVVTALEVLERRIIDRITQALARSPLTNDATRAGAALPVAP